MSISIDEEGTKWIGTDGGGLARFDGSSWTVYDTINSGLPNNYVKSIICDPSNGLQWVGTNNGLVTYDGINWVLYDFSTSGLPSNIVEKIAIDEGGNKKR